MWLLFFFFQAEDGIRDRSPSRGLGDVYKRQDIAKPLGIRRMESLKGGVGVMMDDVLAGVYSFILLVGARWVIG